VAVLSGELHNLLERVAFVGLSAEKSSLSIRSNGVGFADEADDEDVSCFLFFIPNARICKSEINKREK